jgi:ribonuclease HII
MRQAIAALPRYPDYLLIDFLLLPQISLPQKAIPKGDRYWLSIAAASIIAKVTRDRWMIALDGRLPGYDMARHKGYGTRQHRAALQKLGPTPQHRHSFAPIRALDEALNA